MASVQATEWIEAVLHSLANDVADPAVEDATGLQGLLTALVTLSAPFAPLVASAGLAGFVAAGRSPGTTGCSSVARDRRLTPTVNEARQSGDRQILSRSTMSAWWVAPVTNHIMSLSDQISTFLRNLPKATAGCAIPDRKAGTQASRVSARKLAGIEPLVLIEL